MIDMSKECPTCGRDDFASEKGMKQHHTKAHGESIAGVDIECEVCGDMFSVPPSRSDARTCGMGCRNELYASDENPLRNRVELECEVCGGTFSVVPSKADNRRTCGDGGCYSELWDREYTGEDSPHWKGGKVDIECDVCGDVFSVWPAVEDRRKTCSYSCRSKRQKEQVSVECEACGDTFKISRSEADGRRTCGWGCRNELQSREYSGRGHPKWKPQVELKCEVCGGTFHVYPSEAGNRRTCGDDECWSEIMSGETHPAWKGGKVDLECEVCGDTFSVGQFESDRRRVCSTKCMGVMFTGENHPNYAGGDYIYGPGFHEAKKEAVRDRDGRECQHCGRSEAEHIEAYGRKHDVHHIRKAREIDDPEVCNAMDNLVTLCCGKCHKMWDRISPLRPAPPAD